MRDATLGVQVIAVGNLTVGGTAVKLLWSKNLLANSRMLAGKWPFFRVGIVPPRPLHERLLNKLLLRQDITPPKVVSDGQSLLLDSESSGDEPYMLASNLRDVVVLVDKDRVKSGRYAIQKFGCDTLLLDDGFQYWKLRGRRHDVVLIDYQDPFGNGHLLPRGTLREPRHISDVPTPFSLPKSMVPPKNCASEYRRSIPKLASSSVCIIHCSLKTCSPENSRHWSTSGIVDWQPSVASLSPRV